MENRLNIYYPGNTVKPPNPGRKRRAKVIDPDKLPAFEGKVMDIVDKVCAVSKCVWCGYGTDQYFITCPRCSNCQYCGLMDNVDAYRCYLCGNSLPEDARTTTVKITPDNVINITDKARRKGYCKDRGNATI